MTRQAAPAMPGTGMPLSGYLVVLAISVALFVVWGGLLWSVPAGTSHVTRFAVSYLAVIPLVVAVLLATRRFRWTFVVTATGTIWALKLLITAALYVGFVHGGLARDGERAAVPLPAKSHAATSPRASSSDYEPATSSFAKADLRGRVVLGTEPVADAIVYLVDPAPGRGLDPSRSVTVTIEKRRYDAPLYVVKRTDTVTVANRDGVLHTFHLHGDDSAPENVPLPPSSTPRTARVPDPGVYRVGCDTHPDELAWMLVTDHPYVARTDASGAFAIRDVPSGALHIAAIHVDASLALSRARAEVVAAENATLELTLSLHTEPHARAPTKEDARL